MSKLGSIIREKREERGLLLREVASKLNMDTPMLSKIERGVRPLKKEQLEDLSKVLQLNVRALRTIWLADKIYENVRDEELGFEALKVAEKELIQWGKKAKK